MSIRQIAVTLVAGAFISGCAATSVIPVSQNQFILQASAAPACGRTGVAKVATRMAAVETLRRGYIRFIVVGVSSANNVSAISTPPTGAYTTGSATVYGNTAYGSARTTYTGGGIVFAGTFDSDLNILMLNPGEPGFDRGIDAKTVLGENWQELVEKGINTCTD